MKDVNGDMEGLFRRAAEKYPLRTDSADWDRLSAALDNDPGPPSDADEDENRRRRGIFWWWLLLPLAGALAFYGWRATMHPSTHLSKAPAAIMAPVTGTAAAPGTGTTAAPGTGTTAAPGTGTTAAPATVTTAAPATTLAGGAAATTGGAGRQGGGTTDGSMQRTEANRAVTQGGGTAGGGTTGGASAQAGGVSSGDVTSTERSRVTGTGGRRTIGSRTIGSRTTGVRTTGVPGERRGATASAGKAGHTADTDGGNMKSDANNDRFDAAKIDGGATVGGGGIVGRGGLGAGNGVGASNGIDGRNGVEGRSKIDSRRASTAGSFNLMVDVKAPAAREDSSAKQTKKATAKSSHGHGYIGLTGAPDLSSVKMQATKGVGTTWGLLLGYSFNDHWAVESGVSLDRKKYYTAGEYFSKEGDPALLPYTVNSVNGTCNMWEIPLNVRYNFNPGSKITWFATTGLSTYLMTKQQYTYSLETSGSNYPWNQNWSTTVPSNYLFSIINISGGFERQIGQIGNLRIEPYLRIPLSGIGSGKLPIMSAGINIGITRRLW
jgi:Outer membrane protein beta-barrel domain